VCDHGPLGPLVRVISRGNAGGREPTWDENGTGITTCAGWEWESLGSIWNGNLKQRGIGMGNDGVDTEWEREWER